MDDNSCGTSCVVFLVLIWNRQKNEPAEIESNIMSQAKISRETLQLLRHWVAGTWELEPERTLEPSIQKPESKKCFCLAQSHNIFTRTRSLPFCNRVQVLYTPGYFLERGCNKIDDIICFLKKTLQNHQLHVDHMALIRLCSCYWLPLFSFLTFCGSCRSLTSDSDELSVKRYQEQRVTLIDAQLHSTVK